MSSFAEANMNALIKRKMLPGDLWGSGNQRPGRALTGAALYKYYGVYFKHQIVLPYGALSVHKLLRNYFWSKRI